MLQRQRQLTSQLLFKSWQERVNRSLYFISDARQGTGATRSCLCTHCSLCLDIPHLPDNKSGACSHWLNKQAVEHHPVPGSLPTLGRRHRTKPAAQSRDTRAHPVPVTLPLPLAGPEPSEQGHVDTPLLGAQSLGTEGDFEVTVKLWSHPSRALLKFEMLVITVQIEASRIRWSDTPACLLWFRTMSHHQDTVVLSEWEAVSRFWAEEVHCPNPLP